MEKIYLLLEVQLVKYIFLFMSKFFLEFEFQDEKNQVLTINVWLDQVNTWMISFSKKKKLK